MRFDHHINIRWYILAIAAIGGVGFVCYLLVNVCMANQHEQKLEELLTKRYPMIEELSLAKQDLQMLRDRLNSAVGLENPFLLEDADEVADSFRRRLEALAQNHPHLRQRNDHLLQEFQRYYLLSRPLAVDLIAHPEQLHDYKNRVDASLKLWHSMLRMVDSLTDSEQQAFSNLLWNINSAVKNANGISAVLGLMVIAVLLLFAWFISIRVVAMVERSIRLKDEFLATVSHELRTPMNGIVGSLNLLKFSTLDADQQRWLNVAMRSSDDMLMSIDDVLELSEVLSNRAQLQHQRFSFRTRLNAVVNLFHDDLYAQSLGLKVVVSPSVVDNVVSDPGKIFLVIRHLLSNAVKFASFGVIYLRVSAITNAGTSEMRVEVEDCGPGIPQEKIEELFHPFQQLDGSYTREHQGLGVGLAICNSMAKLLGGGVALTNLSQGGLCASFEFSVVLDDAVLGPPNEPSKRVAPGVNSVPRVLVVEDNYVNQAVLKGYLVKLGCEVFTANNGEEALLTLGKESMDMVFMDCQMPIMDGFEATQKIRQMESPVSEVPIVAVTANVMESDHAHCLAVGMDGFLKKPVTIDEVQVELKRRILAFD